MIALGQVSIQRRGESQCLGCALNKTFAWHIVVVRSPCREYVPTDKTFVWVVVSRTRKLSLAQILLRFQLLVD